MKTLKELQQQFISALINADHEAVFLKTIESTPKLNAHQRLSIYRDSITAGLITALKETFPVCQQLVGDDFFIAMAHRYINKNPSSSPDLGEYGENFPVFIADFQSANSVPYLSEVAQLEWAWARCFHGKKPTSLDFIMFSQIPYESQPYLTFQLSENSQLLRSKYPIHTLWHIHQKKYQGEMAVDWNVDAVHLFVGRKDYDVMITELNENEWDFLAAIKKGDTLQQLCENFENTLNYLPRFIQESYITDFKA